jgi:hypothetical protein
LVAARGKRSFVKITPALIITPSSIVTPLQMYAAELIFTRLPISTS